MPIVLENEGSFHRLLVWESIESLDELFELAVVDAKRKAEVRAFKSLNRQREVLSVRVALKKMLGDKCPAILYNSNGKPSLADGAFISISHTGNLIALLVSDKKNVGVDIEMIRTSIVRLSTKFISDEEKEWVGTNPTLDQLHLVWGAKEVLFKLYGLGHVDFKKDLKVLPFDLSKGSTLLASITKEKIKKDYVIHHELINGALLAWGVDL